MAPVIIRTILKPFSLSVLTALILPLSLKVEVLDVVYPRASDGVRWNYHVGLLELALDRSGVEYRLTPTTQELTQPREMLNLHSGLVSVIWAGTSPAFEEQFRAVRVPLYRVWVGVRVCRIDRSGQSRLSAIRTEDGLAGLRMGQGVGWSDVEILRSNGFSVHTARYDLLFNMVSADRFDCYLRGVTEVAKEIAHYGQINRTLAVEDSLLLVYPFATFFFVEPSNEALAQALERGLELATDDGSFQAYFDNHPDIQAVFENLDLDSRRRFNLDNSNMSQATRDIPAQYWLDGALSTAPEVN